MPPNPPTWTGRRATAALDWTRTRGQRNNTPCCLCGQPINYALRHPHPQACTVQHIKPRALFPHLTWARDNWAPAHAVCNERAGTGATLDIGQTAW